MSFSTIVSPETLAGHVDDPAWVVVDCRFSLNNTGRGRLEYLESHIPGAVYAHLDDDLSGPVVPGQTGRHPLPAVEDAAKTFSRWGIADGIQVVAYDDAGGGIAARLWWMLRWLGHHEAAVLDGGWPAWIAAGHPRRRGDKRRARRHFTPRPDPEMIADAARVDAMRNDPSCRLLDARAPERYRGEYEPIDPVAGHIPGARSAPHAENLDKAGRFLPSDMLRSHYEAILSGVPPERAACYCGSGVTAAHDLLAMAVAGLEGARLYPGSWSEWINTMPSEGTA